MIKPMLAAEVKELSDLPKYPLVIQRKLDGVRALWCPNRQKFFSRNGKEFRNRALHEAFKSRLKGFVTPHMLDGELIMSGKSAAETFGIINSHIGPVAGLTFFAFDITHPHMTYEERMDFILNLSHSVQNPIASKVKVAVLGGNTVESEEDILQYVRRNDPKLTWEGVMLKDPKGRYKHGRSTVKESLCVKAKFGATMECIVADFEEGEGKAAGMVGRVKCIDPIANKEFYVGTGMSDNQRKFFWEHRHALRMIAMTTVFHYGRYEKSQLPRTPSTTQWMIPTALAEKWRKLQDQEELARKANTVAENCASGKYDEVLKKSGAHGIKSES